MAGRWMVAAALAALSCSAWAGNGESEEPSPAPALGLSSKPDLPALPQPGAPGEYGKDPLRGLDVAEKIKGLSPALGGGAMTMMPRHAERRLAAAVERMERGGYPDAAIAPLRKNLVRLRATIQDVMSIHGGDFGSRDKDRDGRLSYEEFISFRNYEWDAATKGASAGSIDKAAWKEYYEPKVKAAIALAPQSEKMIRASAEKNLSRAFDFLDEDKDGKMSRAEFFKRLADGFKKLDANADQYLSFSEFSGGILDDDDLPAALEMARSVDAEKKMIDASVRAEARASELIERGTSAARVKDALRGAIDKGVLDAGKASAANAAAPAVNAAAPAEKSR